MDRRQFLKNSAFGAAAIALPAAGLKPNFTAENQNYYMITFVSTIDYWKDCFRGMQDAAAFLGTNVNVAYTGTPQNDIAAEASVLDDVVGQKPNGILMTCLNADGLKPGIDTAIKQDIPVVCFDADSPLSSRYCFVGTGNVYAGVVAARYLGPIVQGGGKVAISSVKTQLNHIQRRQGFLDTLKAEFNGATVPDDLILDNENNVNKAAETMAVLLQANPDIKGVFCTDAVGAVGVSQAVLAVGRKDINIIGFDYDESTLDLIDSNDLGATLAQGTWQMGFWGMIQLFMVANSQIKSVSNWKAAGISPLPPNIDTGVVVITKDNSKYWRVVKS